MKENQPNITHVIPPSFDISHSKQENSLRMIPTARSKERIVVVALVVKTTQYTNCVQRQNCLAYCSYMYCFSDKNSLFLLGVPLIKKTCFALEFGHNHLTPSPLPLPHKCFLELYKFQFQNYHAAPPPPYFSELGGYLGK